MLVTLGNPYHQRARPGRTANSGVESGL